MATLLTTNQAAKRRGVSTQTLRSQARFARKRGIELRAPESEWPDRRTPMYDQEVLDKYFDEIRPMRDWAIPLEEQVPYARKKVASKGAEGEKAKAVKATKSA